MFIGLSKPHAYFVEASVLGEVWSFGLKRGAAEKLDAIQSNRKCKVHL